MSIKKQFNFFIIPFLLLSFLITLTGCTQFKEDIGKLNPAKFYGEWYSPESGYFVFDKNKTFKWYKDNTKEESNVKVGTWKIIFATRAGMKEKYSDIILDEDYIIIDGKKTIASKENGHNLTELAIAEYNEQKMSIVNITSGRSYKVIKQLK